MYVPRAAGAGARTAGGGASATEPSVAVDWAHAVSAAAASTTIARRSAMFIRGMNVIPGWPSCL
jgi:hypothetical protein